LFRPHDGNAPHDFPVGVVLVKQEGGQALSRVIGRFGDKNEVSGFSRASDEVLGAVDDPVVTLPDGGGLHHRRIGARPGRRFRHGKGRLNLAIDDGLKPALLLFGRRHLLKHHHVAVVGRGRVEYHRAEYGAIHLLVAGRHFHYAATLATPRFWHLQRPQSLAARLRPHFLKQAWFNVVVLVEGSTILLEGNEDFVHEFTDLHPQPFALFGQIEIHI